MQRGVTTKPPETVATGVIQSIADGLSIALVRPGLLLVPLLLDAYLWLGWRLSLVSLTSAIGARVGTVDSARGPEVVERLEELGHGDAAWILALQAPSLLSDASRADVYSWRARPEWAPSEPWLAAALLVALILGAALLPMIYGVLIADAALERQRPMARVIRAIALAWARFFGLVLIMIALGLVAMIPFFVFAFILALGGAGAESMIVSGAALVVAALFVLLWFAPDAILVNEVGPIRAVRFSIGVIRAAFWQSLGLIAASMLISLGLSEVWLRLADNAPGLAIGALLHAFTATGLTLASILFYSSRIRLVRPETAADLPSSARQ